MSAAIADRFADNQSWSDRLWRIWRAMRRRQKPAWMPTQPYGGMERHEFDHYCREQAREWDEYVKSTPESPLPQ